MKELDDSQIKKLVPTLRRWNKEPTKITKHDLAEYKCCCVSRLFVQFRIPIHQYKKQMTCFDY